MKGDAAECVLLSPDEYVRLVEDAEDARLFALAAERLSRSGSGGPIPEEKVWERLGLTQAELDSVGEAEFE